jgi:hypothetical protein
MRPLLRLEDEQHCCAISGSYLWTTPKRSASRQFFWCNALRLLTPYNFALLLLEHSGSTSTIDCVK